MLTSTPRSTPYKQMHSAGTDRSEEEHDEVHEAADEDDGDEQEGAPNRTVVLERRMAELEAEVRHLRSELEWQGHELLRRADSSSSR